MLNDETHLAQPVRWLEKLFYEAVEVKTATAQYLQSHSRQISSTIKGSSTMSQVPTKQVPKGETSKHMTSEIRAEKAGSIEVVDEIWRLEEEIKEVKFLQQTFQNRPEDI